MTEVLGNIILVGGSGAGKSSIINMIAGTKVAPISSAAIGCTFESTSHTLPVHGRNFKFFDTAGLDEGVRGKVERGVAIAKVYKLITRLDGGINLLMICMRGPRIKDTADQNWEIFHEIICKKQIPTTLVVTGLENEENLDEWWWNNRGTFEDQGIRPDDTACITTIRGRTLWDGCRVFDDHYENSLAKIQNLILNRVLLRPLRINKINWFYEVARKFFSFFGWTKIREPKEVQKIADACGMSTEERARFREELAKIDIW
ncbi:hypothetical protein K503DRAFT_870704 [Rhizopogon vinicolor AM-OR11-026]|uniref:G domain-containing protein n=1 Tax=Rhizopogon vinicolor AM-OR11-026 TaxID=1314800 RepID=A0A1B7MF81_9AGAM|nr:hypothetical protein K503DRAFT_870704 [Rhizopogon vinicolor AM-OR11-026]